MSTTTTTPRFVDNGDGTVTDNQTGLIWEKKDNTCPGIHCVNDTYSWNVSGSPYPPDGTAFTSFLNTLNGGATGVGNCVSSDGNTQTGGFNNYCDWRLPTIGELNSIVDRSASGCLSGSPCIDPVFGPTVPSIYWTSTTFAGDPFGAWDTDFGNGVVRVGSKDNSIFVRAVRGPRAPSTTPHFVDNGDGTVTDNQTGLIWEKKDYTCPGIHCRNDTYTWCVDADTNFVCDNGGVPDGTAFTTFLNMLNGGATGVGNCVSADGSTQTGGFDNHCDWRLPTIAELRTIIDTSQANCGGGFDACIDPTFGPTAAGGYWSSTSFAGNPNYAWFVRFDNGFVFNSTKAIFTFLRAVRGGS